MKPTLLLPFSVLLLAAPLFSQQDHVTRFDFFAGYAYLNSPAIKLPEHGVQFQIGVRPKTWYSVGFDYSNTRGDLTLTPNLLPTPLQQSLAATLQQLAAAGQLPPGYSLTVPAHSRTQTFSLGPQLAFRHFRKVTFFVRPSMGAIREVAIPFPSDPIAKNIIAGLVPSGKKMDWTGFYGAGGGIDLLFNNHLAFRIQGDYVWDHLFNDILKGGRRTFRLGIGPAFNFGRNIVK